MYKGPLADETTKGHFTGHETFPLRYLWLYKAYKEVADLSKENQRKNPFSNPDAIVAFGVGKNMVKSIRHWALACKIIEHKDGSFKPTNIGEFLFNPETGRDRFMEKEATLWLIHWMVAGQWGKNFNLVLRLSTIFLKGNLNVKTSSNPYKIYAKTWKWKRTSETTIKRDVDCFLRSYVHQGNEEVFGRLHRIRSVGIRN